jgi:hypothetical protein
MISGATHKDQLMRVSIVTTNDIIKITSPRLFDFRIINSSQKSCTYNCLTPSGGIIFFCFRLKSTFVLLLLMLFCPSVSTSAFPPVVDLVFDGDG